jgi:hypothetical protein
MVGKLEIVDEIFKEIHEIYESYDGGLIHLDNTSEDQIKESIKKAINYTGSPLKLKDNIDEFSDLAKTFINEVDKKHPFVNLPEDEDFYMARHKLVDKLNDL